MDPVGQGSFIPKESLTVTRNAGGGLGLLSLLGLLIFVLSIVSAGGVFAYERILNSQIAEKDESLRLAEGAFDAGTIQDLLRLDNRLIQAQALLQRHVSPSAIFYFLSANTLEWVQLSSFDFALQPDGTAKIALGGIADSFSSVALQSDRFGGSKVLRDVVFSGITISESGKVNFSVGSSVDPALILYSRNIEQAPATEQQQPVQ